jgi:hypothetical protein
MKTPPLSPRQARHSGQAGSRLGLCERRDTWHDPPASWQALSHLLTNTPAVCRKFCILPAVMALGASLASGDEAALWRRLDAGKKRGLLYAAESQSLSFR